jgi:hypothetical protein
MLQVEILLLRRGGNSLLREKGETIMTRYCINGWDDYSRAYFRDIGRFTEYEWERLLDGETIEKNGNVFRIHQDD